MYDHLGENSQWGPSVRCLSFGHWKNCVVLCLGVVCKNGGVRTQSHRETPGVSTLEDGYM